MLQEDETVQAEVLAEVTKQMESISRALVGAWRCTRLAWRASVMHGSNPCAGCMQRNTSSSLLAAAPLIVGMPTIRTPAAQPAQDVQGTIIAHLWRTMPGNHSHLLQRNQNVLPVVPQTEATGQQQVGWWRGWMKRFSEQ